MLISHRFRFIYTKTAKTAGTSIEAYFERFCMREGEWSPAHQRDVYESEAGVIGYRGPRSPDKKWYNHMPASKIRDRVGSETWDRYFKFCAIRNPWEKTVSAFDFSGREHGLPPGAEGLLYRLKHPFHDAEQLRFLHWLETRGPLLDRGAYVIGGRICVDDFVRFESLHSDLERICARLGVPWEPAELPRYKVGIKRETSTVARLYRAPARRLVERAFAFEIARFGYRFEAAGRSDPGPLRAKP